jgi:CMP-N-acetylneuraminate monooxygenase
MEPSHYIAVAESAGAGGDARTRVALGPVAELGRLPRPVEVEGLSFFLIRNGDGFQLLSRVCPHKGGIVEDAGSCFECPRHGWVFERDSGAGITSPAQGLASYPVFELESSLYADLPVGSVDRERQRRAPTAPLTFQLHAHACIEVKYRGFSFLTDPWLEGPAFFGSWLHYPAPRVDARKLRPSAIWISHEHSDHFHEPTLSLLPPSTPVYVPDFPNRRLPARLHALGFQNVVALPFGEPVDVSDGVRITVFEPASLWNDAILLFEVEGFRWLNLNDAGVNHRIAQLVGPVDLISSTFSPGASGYPLTWTHLSDEEKVDILDRSRQGSLDMLRDAVRAYGARELLPFASFFSLWRPEHLRYLSLFRKNAPADVVAAFEGTDVDVIDLLPGEVWNAANGKRTRLPLESRETIFDPERMLAHATERWDAELFASAFPTGASPTAAEVQAYFLRLNDAPEMRFCEDLTCSIRGLDADGRTELEVSFEVADGRLAVQAERYAHPNVVIALPCPVLGHIVAEDVSWDEAFIGYWCELSRAPDVYHAGFWRLLQAPYYERAAGLSGGSPLGADATIAGVLEEYGDVADRILRRHGLYCLGCQHSPFETIRLGARKHALTDEQVDRIVAELGELAPLRAQQVSSP